MGASLENKGLFELTIQDRVQWPQSPATDGGFSRRGHPVRQEGTKTSNENQPLRPQPLEGPPFLC